MNQNQNQKSKKLCKKLVYGDIAVPSIIYGIILDEDDDFLIFQTGKRDYRISKNMIISVEDTTMLFRGDL